MGRGGFMERMGGARGLLAQGLLIFGLVVLAVWLSGNAGANIEARGISTGYGFLDREAGFDIAQNLVPYEPTDTYARVFLVGALNTILVASMGIVTATVIGLIAGVMRVSRNYLGRLVATTYVEIARNTPLPVQILVWYNIALLLPPPRSALGADGVAFLTNRGVYLPQLWLNGLADVAVWGSVAFILAAFFVSARLRRLRTEHGKGASPHWGWAVAGVGVLLAFLGTGNPIGIDVPHREGFGFSGGFTMSPALMALWIALSFYTGSFIAEIVRGGLTAVAKGQGEAARAIGLSEGQTLRLVILPQAMRVIVPPLASQYLNLTKNSSLAVIIGYPDLVAVFAGTSLNQTGQAIETLSLVMLFYLACSLSVSLFMNWYNAQSAVWATPR
ncbi:MAG: ABC transporter permease subunit [Caulobacteraceae bacterium]|nr:ABC transporter permease subunit [Caulobacteraceae bacterium]